MRSSFWLGVAAVALAAAPAAARAAGASGITYDCDTAANHFSELDLPALPGPFTVTGKVRVNALAGSKAYAPIARVQIAAAAMPGQSPGVFAGFSLSALAANPKKTPSGAPAIQMLSFNANGKEDELLPMSVMIPAGTVQPFELSYDGSQVSVTLGTEARRFPLQTDEPVVRIVCSTGEFLFTELAIKAGG